jgi:anti-sigma regulatory factor (Ser/Thr protein kinase)
MTDHKSKTVQPQSIRFHSGPAPEPGRVVLEREIPSDLALVTPLIIRVSEFLLGQKLLPADFKNKFQLCLDEALRNAVTHGNCAQFGKKVRLRVFVNDEKWGVMIEDEGKGFSQEKVPDALADRSLWGEGGRGIHLMAHYMDQVDFYSNGRVLLMAKSL